MTASNTCGRFKTINIKTTIVATMCANKKLEVSFDEILKTKNFFEKKLKDSNLQGKVEWGSEAIKDLKREDDSFFIGEQFVNCTGDWIKINDVLAYCDVDTLGYIFEYQDIIQNKKSSQDMERI